MIFPIIVLPKDWSRMGPEALRFTLLHELAHIKRWDVAQQLLARLASSIYWFNPACWIALRQLRVERELACDDCVLGVAARAEDYAHELVKIAKSYRPQATLVGVAIAHSSDLRVRVESLLDAGRDHSPMDAQRARIMSIAACAFVVLLASTKIGVTALADSAAENDVAPGQTNHELRYAAIVSDTRGRPVSSANVYRLYWYGSALPDQRFRQPVATTGPDGRFAFSVAFSDELKNSTAVHAVLHVTAPGHGFTSVNSIDYETTGNLSKFFEGRGDQQLANRQIRSTINLPDDVPLRGRILDVDGQPVANAKIRPRSILHSPEPGGNLDAWESEATTGRVNFFKLRNQLKLRSTLGGRDWLVGIAQYVMSDDDGYFEFPGIGADRIIDLHVTGPGIEASQLTARTRTGEILQFPSGDRKKICFANDFMFVAGPGGKVQGRVTDADSGAPIAGLRVAAGSQSSRFGIGKPWLFTETDEDGRYELDGYSLDGSQRVSVAVHNDLGYLPAGGSVELEFGSPVLTRDFELYKGHLLKGRVIHENTGEPLAGVAHYYVAQDNPELKRIRDFAHSMIDMEALANQEGEFELVVPKGIGIVGFVPNRDSNRFPRGVESDLIDVRYSEDRGVKIFRTRPRPVISSNECLLQQVTIRDDQPNQLELSLTSGESVTCKIADAQGSPVNGCSVLRGRIGNAFYEEIEGAEFEVDGVLDDTERHLFAFHRKLGLGGTAILRGADVSPALTMLPLGSIQGRLVDPQGEPLRVYVNMNFGGAYAPGTNLTNDLGEPGRPGLAESDEDGNFKVEGLLPNYKYGFTTTIKGVAQPIALDIDVEPGEAKDIGTVTPGKLSGDR